MDEQRVRELIDTVRGGDIAAFDDLVALFREPLEASVRSRLAAQGLHSLEAEEIVQETFARALQALERFRFEGEEAFGRWLSGIARRVILASARMARRHRALEQTGEVPASDVSPSRALSREERLRRLQESLCGLSDDYREVILLARIEGLTMGEIAERMGRSPDAVKKLLARALRKLREVFGETDSLRLPERTVGRARSGCRQGPQP